MPWCPQCRFEYEMHVKVCGECDSELVEALPPEDEVLPMDSIFRAGDEMTAVNVANILRDAGIEARVLSEQVPMYDGIFTFGQGFWGEVLVPRPDSGRSRLILDDYLKDLAGRDEDALDVGEPLEDAGA